MFFTNSEISFNEKINHDKKFFSIEATKCTVWISIHVFVSFVFYSLETSSWMSVIYEMKQLFLNGLSIFGVRELFLFMLFQLQSAVK